MKREEAVALLKELEADHLIQPSLIHIQRRTPDNYKLQMKGDFSYQEIETFLKNRGFSCEENKEDYLTIFKL
jgi:hypothetical protein